ncbi:ImmA/IrrE family metallo-endopeptidase [Paenarthrobacter nicotinovorans]|uniref:ImmA/IrrE family metallo-endopeptidase n=1 Tax=Paenarthrobacter nicotinovorans TaxID=29320 RepID=A0ABV0GT38_PAENI
MLSTSRKRQITQIATRTLMHNGINMTRQVDIFSLIRKNRLVLRFMDLDRLLGAFVPGSPGGVIINSKLPAALQRYTAAHEFAHFALHTEVFAFDGQLEVEGRTPSGLESEAQLFASHLLMPLPLMARAAKDVGLERGSDPNADQVYGIAGIAGVSFSAALVQLRNLGMLNWAQMQSLQGVRPQSVEVKRTFGEKLTDRGAHVWSPVELGRGNVQDLYVGDLVAVDLPENRTTGFRWFVSQSTDADSADYSIDSDPQDITALDRFMLATAPAITVGTTRVSPRDPMIGGGGRRQILIRATSRGTWRVILSYAPVQNPTNSVESLNVNAELHLRPGQEQRRLILESFRASADGEVTS